jgi:hypothetical protein
LLKWTDIRWEAPMGGSALNFLKAEWKVSDTGSVHWASSLSLLPFLAIASSVLRYRHLINPFVSSSNLYIHGIYFDSTYIHEKPCVLFTAFTSMSNLGKLFFIDVNAVKSTPLGKLCVLHWCACCKVYTVIWVNCSSLM